MIQLNPKIPKHGHSGFNNYITVQKKTQKLVFDTGQTWQIEILPD